MNAPTDVLGTPLAVGQKVGVAFSYSQASVGHIRLGVIQEMYEDKKQYSPTEGEVVFRIMWGPDDRTPNKLSPKISYGSKTRWIVL